MNDFLDFTPQYIHKINLSIKYKAHGFPPASYLFRENIKKSLSSIKEYLAKHNSAAIDFIHIHGDIYLKSALFLKKSLNVPLFYASRCNDIDRAHILRKIRGAGRLPLQKYLFSIIYEPINRHREKQIAAYSEIITFINSSDRDCFVKRTKCNMSKTTIITNHIGLPRCTAEFKNKNTSTNVQTLVYVGDLSANKGLWNLLPALVLLKKKGYALHCYVLGRSKEVDKITAFIKKLDIEEIVFIEGYQYPFPYFVKCDLFVNPTLYDSFSNATAESLHTGCPVIASSVGGLPDLLQYPDLLFESGNIQEIADRIERCVREPEFYRHIRTLCKERADAHHFDWAEQFESAMQQYLANNSH